MTEEKDLGSFRVWPGARLPGTRLVSDDATLVELYEYLIEIKPYCSYLNHHQRKPVELLPAFQRFNSQSQPSILIGQLIGTPGLLMRSKIKCSSNRCSLSVGYKWLASHAVEKSISHVLTCLEFLGNLSGYEDDGSYLSASDHLHPSRPNDT